MRSTLFFFSRTIFVEFFFKGFYGFKIFHFIVFKNMLQDVGAMVYMVRKNECFMWLKNALYSEEWF